MKINIGITVKLDNLMKAKKVAENKFNGKLSHYIDALIEKDK